MPVLIHCTQKLLAEVPANLFDPDAAGESWHANLFRIERRKCVLFTHDTTLFSVFVPEWRKPDFARLDQVFVQRLFKAMVWEGLPQEQIEAALESCRTVRCTRSSSRSVLGSMNEMRFQIEWGVADAGGLDLIDLADLHRWLNRTIFSAIGYRNPVEGFREYLASLGG